MLASKNKIGLYEFDINVTGLKKSRKLKGLIDTGSTDCACTYEVITTLWARPIDHDWISILTLEGIKRKKCLIYALNIEFNGKNETVPVIRVPNLEDGIHFLFGLTILDKCTIIKKKNKLDINWI